MSTGRFRFLAPSPRLDSDIGKWAAELRRIEDLGFHAVTVSEHYSNGWAMDALTAMNYALASTTHLRAIPLVLNNDLHHPAILAKAIATSDVLSAGRTGVGIGAGWKVDDYEALGISYEAPPIRIARLEEALQILSAFFAGSTVNFDGDHYKLTNLEALPLPIQVPRPPILVGGGGETMLAMAGRYADIASVYAQLGPGGFDEYAAEGLSRENIDKKIARVRKAASNANRPAPEIHFSCFVVTVAGVQSTPIRPAFTDYIEAHSGRFADSPASLRGDVNDCVDKLQRWREELGISYWSLGGNLSAIAPIVERLSAE